MISIRDVSLVYKSPTDPVTVFENISAEIKQGEFVAIVGPSGCGKSTLLRMMGDLLTPSSNVETSGKIITNGLEPKQARELGYFSFIFRDTMMLAWRTIKENLEVPSELIRRTNKIDTNSIVEILGLADYLDAHPYELSPFMRQKVSIARALSLSPKIIFIDDLLHELTKEEKKELYEDKVKICKEFNATTIFTTTNVDEAISLADRVIIMADKPATILHEETIPKKAKIHGLEHKSLSRKLTEVLQCANS